MNENLGKQVVLTASAAEGEGEASLSGIRVVGIALEVVLGNGRGQPAAGRRRESLLNNISVLKRPEGVNIRMILNEVREELKKLYDCGA